VLILGVVLGLGLTIQGVNANIESNVRQIRETLGTDVLVFPPGSFGANFLSTGEILDAEIMKELQDLQHVEEVAGRVVGRLESTSLEIPSFGGRSGRRLDAAVGPLVLLNGITPGQPLNIFIGGEAELTSGRNLIVEDETRNVALISETLAIDNNLGIGSFFTINEEDFEVVGLFTTGTRFGDINLFLPLQVTQRLLGLEEGVNSIVVTVDSLDNVESTLAAMRNLLGDRADVFSPLTAATRFTESSLGNITSIVDTAANITLVIAGIVVLFTMILIVRGAIREIGTLKAIGASNTQVLLQFASQALFLTLLGALLGIGAYLLAGQALSGDAGMGRIFIVEISVTGGMSYLSWAILAAIVGGLLPSLYAAKLNPAEVLRHG
jgi:putative ABC transport system permease protein